MRETLVIDRVAVLDLIKRSSAISPVITPYRYIVVTDPQISRVLSQSSDRSHVSDRVISAHTEYQEIMAETNRLNKFLELETTNAWAKYKSQHTPGHDSLQHTYALLLLARWFDADILCSRSRWILLRELFRAVSVKYVDEPKLGKSPSITTSDTLFPGRNSNELSKLQHAKRLDEPFSYHVISMREQDEKKSISEKSWRELLETVVGRSGAIAIIILAGLGAFAMAVYENWNSLLPRLVWIAGKAQELFGL
jgi:hypothetical protein